MIFDVFSGRLSRRRQVDRPLSPARTRGCAERLRADRRQGGAASATSRVMASPPSRSAVSLAPARACAVARSRSSGRPRAMSARPSWTGCGRGTAAHRAARRSPRPRRTGLGLLVALQGRGEPAERPGDRAVHDRSAGRELAGERRQQLVQLPARSTTPRREQTSAQMNTAPDHTASQAARSWKSSASASSRASVSRPLSHQAHAAPARQREGCPARPRPAPPARELPGPALLQANDVSSARRRRVAASGSPDALAASNASIAHCSDACRSPCVNAQANSSSSRNQTKDGCGTEAASVLIVVRADSACERSPVSSATSHCLLAARSSARGRSGAARARAARRSAVCAARSCRAPRWPSRQ